MTKIYYAADCDINLLKGKKEISTAWNLGPEQKDVKTVEEIVKKLCKKINNIKYKADKTKQALKGTESTTAQLELDAQIASLAEGGFTTWALATGKMSIGSILKISALLTKFASEMGQIIASEFGNQDVEKLGSATNTGGTNANT